MNRVIGWAAIVATGLFLGWVLFFGLPKWYAAGHAARVSAVAASKTPPPVATTAERKITATIYYVSEDGMALVPIKRDVPYGGTPAEQARAIVQAQLTPAAPQVVPFPAGARLIDVFVTDRGDAFVDLAGSTVSGHTGGTIDEALSVYAIVDALTVNLPAITHVQILIDGKEVDTLAGHIDLRHPLAKSLDWIVHDTH